MKFLTACLSLIITAQVYAAVELPTLRFTPGVDEGPNPDSHCYDYICSGTQFPVPEGNYYFFLDGKLCFVFRDKPGHINIVREIGGSDPLEGFNRTVFSLTDFFMSWVFRPIGTVYCTIMPRPAIKAVNNIADNVNFPKRFLSCLFQAKFYDSGVAFTRFVFNSSVGVAGIWDASEYFLGLYKRDEDFGQVFASWGIGPGCYVFVPGEGPCNLRNAVGKVFDYALDIKSYIYGAQATTAFHRLLAQYEDYDMLMKTSADPYEVLKKFWLIQRQNMVDDNNLNVQFAGKDSGDGSKAEEGLSYDELKYVKMDSYGSQGVEIDTLKALFFDVQKEKQSLWTYLSLFNSDFISQGSSYSIQLQKDKDPMEYRFWKQPDNPEAPLMLLIPGIGSHYRDSKALALAETLHDQGFAVATICSAFNWHFMETASSVDAPGFLPADAEDTRKAWAKIIPQIKKGDGINPKRVIMIGYSMGALHSLYIAKLEEQQNTLGVDRYLAINPPVNLLYSINKLDKYYNIHKQWPKDELIKRSTVAFGKMMVVAQRRYRFHDDVNPETPSFYEAAHHRLDIEKEEAQYLIGSAFKMNLQEILFSMHRSGKFTNLKTEYKWCNKDDLYDETMQLTFNDYVRKILFEHHKHRFGKNVTEAEFVEKISNAANMHSFEEHFIDNPDIKIIHTKNDFLLTDQDRLWLKDVFKDEIVFFEHGGHLGNLHFRQVHNKIRELLRPTPVVSQEQRKYYRETYVSLAAPYSIPSMPPPGSDFHNPR